MDKYVWGEDKAKIAQAAEMMATVSAHFGYAGLLKMYVSGLPEDDQMVAIVHINLLAKGKTNSLLPEDWDLDEYIAKTIRDMQ